MPDDALSPDLPRSLQVEVTGSCNLSCRMCLVRYRPKIGRRSGALDAGTFRRLLDELPELERVTLQGLGEPLLAPDLLPMIEEAAGRGIVVGFNTNATLLDRRAAERLVAAGLDWLHVSLDGATAATYEGIRDGSDFALVRRNLRTLLEVRAAAGATRPRVLLVFVAMRRNVAELPALVRLAAEWGVDGLFVQNLSHVFSDTDPAGAYAEIRAFAEREALWGRAAEEAERTFAVARAEAETLGLELRLPRLAPPPAETPQPVGRACGWPWDGAYVTHEGDVQPCCMVMGSERARLGNVGRRTFAEVWHDEGYRRFRAGLLEGGETPDVCRGCALYRRVF